MSNGTKIVNDPSGKKLVVTHTFDAPVQEVWQAWTDSSLLDKWWAPKPYRAETKELDFKVGGRWLYAMVSPERDKHWGSVKFTAIENGRSFRADSIFSDERGNKLDDSSVGHWTNRFEENEGRTDAIIELAFDNEQDLEKIVAMGFKEGFTMGLSNLDELLSQS